MKRVLILAAAGEAALGLVLLVYPSIVVRLLFGADIAGAGIVMCRIAGIALIALGGACRPGSPLVGMLTYSSVVALYLIYLGLAGEWVGSPLWPAVAIHTILTFLLARAWLKNRQISRSRPQEDALSKH
jgi:uncharacterized membrane protein